jgi:hypothetical protein
MASSRIAPSVVLYRFAVLAATVVGLLLVCSTARADFGLKPQPEGFEASLLDSTGAPENEPQAGAHPFDQQVNFVMKTTQPDYPETGAEGYPGQEPTGIEGPDGQVKTIVTNLIPGLIGNPRAVPLCAQSDFPAESGYGASRCPSKTQIGTASLTLSIGPSKPIEHQFVPVFNLQAPKGMIARLGFIEVAPIFVDIKLRTNGDYGITATVNNTSQAANVYGVKLTLWGVPADHGHDKDRFLQGAFQPGDPPGSGIGLESKEPRVAFMSNPTRCGVPLVSTMLVDSWQDPGLFPPASLADPLTFTGCSQLEFEPTISSKPSTDIADAPSGLEFGIHIPQNTDPDGLTTAHMRDAVVTLPPGMTVNPPSADVLSACSMEQVGISPSGVPNGNPVRCPDASRLGKATVVTPALDHPLPARLYLAEQENNPFGSLLAMYMVIDDPESGLFIKLPGRIEPDPNTGQLTVSFLENPQTPIEDIKIELPGGTHASLKTPADCGTYTTAAALTPWTAPEGPTAHPTDSFTLNRGPDGGACPQGGSAAPNQPTFVAGTTDPTAKAFAPFTLKLTRADGTQRLSSIATTLPKGLLGKLAGVPYCSDAALAAAAGKSGRSEQSSPSCPAASEVGSVSVGAGAGATPIDVPGKVYLAGPYKGAPLSLAVITPAVAGPFDLGNVVVRNALYIDPETAQARAVSDPLPTILKGIPLDLRSVALKIDRPAFTLNPSNCSPTSVLGSATSVFNQVASLSMPFQTDECSRLGFKPKLSLSLKGGTERSDYPALTAVLTARPGDANIARTVVAMPHSEFLAQNHIRTICTRVQFAADACPAGSIYGEAKAVTPLLDKPLEGPVYLRSSSNPLPDLVAALHGQIDVDLVGRIDSVKGGIRASFDSVPDAPVTKFILKMRGGKKGLLENSRNLCNSTNRATVEMDAQNGRAADSTPELKNGCKKARKGKSHKRSSRR